MLCIKRSRTRRSNPSPRVRMCACGRESPWYALSSERIPYLRAFWFDLCSICHPCRSCRRFPTSPHQTRRRLSLSRHFSATRTQPRNRLAPYPRRKPPMLQPTVPNARPPLALFLFLSLSLALSLSLSLSLSAIHLARRGTRSSSAGSLFVATGLRRGRAAGTEPSRPCRGGHRRRACGRGDRGEVITAAHRIITGISAACMYIHHGS